jgi:hypothetical protein
LRDQTAEVDRLIVLQGLGNERAVREVEALLRRFEIASMVGDANAVAAARNYWG